MDGDQAPKITNDKSLPTSLLGGDSVSNIRITEFIFERHKFRKVELANYDLVDHKLIQAGRKKA